MTTGLSIYLKSKRSCAVGSDGSMFAGYGATRHLCEYEPDRLRVLGIAYCAFSRGEEAWVGVCESSSGGWERGCCVRRADRAYPPMDLTDIHGDGTSWWVRHVCLVGEYPAM